ncbi:DUF2066 domain-containing protein [Zavarzinia sp. CC-PAN008]|uniref:DUF2066 domain-containing protein n=1 Tax=Zavarzinia sp. CC-PAN008 TaxID=3243332 RepID=UPI003F7470E2
MNVRLSRPILFLLLALPALALALAVPGGRAVAQDASMTVTGVEVDVTAATAIEARDQALLEGQTKALGQLIERLTGQPAPNVGANTAAGLVQGTSVENERVSATRYAATLTVEFRRSRVESFLESQGTSFARAARKPLVIVPVLSGPGGAVLWDDPNPWRDAWNAHDSSGALLPLLVPQGDIEDLRTIQADQAAGGDEAALKALASRYGANEVLVVDARMTGDPGQGMSVATIRLTPDGLERGSQDFGGEGGEQALLARAVEAVARMVEEEYRSRASKPPEPMQTIQVATRYGSLDEWLMLRNRLAAVPAVKDVRVAEQTLSGARLTVTYQGEAAALQAALGAQGLNMALDGGQWRLGVGPVIAPMATPVLSPPPSGGAFGNPDGAYGSPEPYYGGAGGYPGSP